jgi:hypothetical protein
MTSKELLALIETIQARVKSRSIIWDKSEPAVYAGRFPPDQYTSWDFEFMGHKLTLEIHEYTEM